MKKKPIDFIMVILFFVSVCHVFGEAYPRVEVPWDNNIEEIISADPDAKIKLYYEIIPSIEKVYEEMWAEFNEEYKKWKDSGGGNEGKLPACIFEAFNDLKKQKTIIIHLTIRKLKDFPNGRIPICHVLGEYFSAKMEISLWKGMWIFGLWKKNYLDLDSGARYCLKAVIFHELGVRYFMHIPFPGTWMKRLGDRGFGGG